MREILFRGKLIDRDEWIEGSLIIDENNNYYIGRAIMPKPTEAINFMVARRNGKTFNRFIGIGFAMVIPETVGQFTGLLDTDGNRIFEGDIVKFDDELYHIIFVDGCYRIARKGCYSFTLHNLHSSFEIVGNIHDNPELFKCEV